MSTITPAVMPLSRTRLPTLAPRPPGSSPPELERPIVKEHTEDEWYQQRLIIRELYITEKRKLNEVMAVMEAKYGFAATEQMYKKRFKKWNIRKRDYRKTPRSGSPSSGSSVSSNSDSPSNSSLVSGPAPRISNGDLGNDINYDDHGDEEYDNDGDDCDNDHDEKGAGVITVAGPRVVVGPSYSIQLQVKEDASLQNILHRVSSWNQAKLETYCVSSDPMSVYLANPDQPPIQDSRTMYRTFELVFDLWDQGNGNLAGRAARKGFYVLEFVLKEDHPDLIWHILDTVYDMIKHRHTTLLSMFLVHALRLAATQLPGNHPVLGILTDLIKCDHQTERGLKLICYLLEQAWLSNFNLLSERIDSKTPQDLWLYEQLIWDGRTQLRRDSGSGSQQMMRRALEELSRSQDPSMHDHDYRKLRIDALTLEFTQMDLKDKVKAERLARRLLAQTNREDGPASNDRFHAYARKMLARIYESKESYAKVEENLKLAIEKREIAHGRTALRVVRDMWVLAKFYQKSGNYEKEAETIAEALRRANIYLLNDDWEREG